MKEEELKQIIQRHFNLNRFSFEISDNVIPNDDSTYFVCSGMQNLKQRFAAKDLGRLGNLQTCIRVNDLDEVGDGTHLSLFKMLGNFSFGNGDYEVSVKMWASILFQLGLWHNSSVHIHPEADDHWKLWGIYTDRLVSDSDCKWSDGNIGGYCCEIYYNGLEIGNLVNPLGHSTDVGFGWERLLQVLQGKERVSDTDLFDTSLTYLQRDHVRTLACFKQNDIFPTNKGRGYICKKLIRNLLRENIDFSYSGLEDWLDVERSKILKIVNNGQNLLKKHGGKPESWWMDTLGITKEELNKFV